MRSPKRTDEEFAGAVAGSLSMRQTLLSLGMSATGSAYPSAKRRIERLGLDTTHWVGQASNRGRKFLRKPARPLSDILVENSDYRSRRLLKQRLIREGLLEEECGVCGLTDWQGKSITLQLDHINGVNDDHRLENLRLLCPNCHSQTDTFCGRNLRKEPDPCPDCGGPKGKKSVRCQPCSVVARWGKPAERSIQAPAGTRAHRSASPSSPDLVCSSCRGVKSKKASLCKKCSDRTKGLAQPKKAEWPSVEDLLREIRETSFVAVGRRLGVSDNAVRKHLRTRLGDDWKSLL